jgi:hypothetical protein
MCRCVAAKKQKREKRARTEGDLIAVAVCVADLAKSFGSFSISRLGYCTGTSLGLLYFQFIIKELDGLTRGLTPLCPIRIRLRMTEFTFKRCLLSTRSQSGELMIMREKVFSGFLLSPIQSDLTMLTTWSCPQESDHSSVFVLSPVILQTVSSTCLRPFDSFVLHAHSPGRLESTVDNRSSAA